MKPLIEWLRRKLAAPMVWTQEQLKFKRRIEDEILRDRADSKAFDAQMADELKLRTEQARERIQFAREVRIAETLCRVPEQECRALAESVTGKEALSERQVSTVFKERLWELELALEDRGWVRELTIAALEFSRYGVQQLIRICRLYAIKLPIMKRIAEICELYVFGRGYEIRSDDDKTNESVQEFLRRNKAELGHTGLSQKERDIQTDGALYFALETPPNGQVKVIMIDALEIMDVLTDPDDTSKVWFFQRQWSRLEIDYASGRQTPTPLKCWYPSLEYLMSKPAQKPKSMGSVEVNWNMPILRANAGASPAKWRWPVPPIYGSLDFARAYKDALEDYATVRRTLARFALMVETKGGPGAIAAYNALFSTTFADNVGLQPERNPPPVVASAHIGGPGNTVTAFKSAGAQSNPEETRRLLLMAAAGAGMPETFFGDASTGSLATAVSLDRPTELKFTAIQQRWKSVLKLIVEYDLMVEGTTPGNRLYEARRKDPAPQPVDITVTFPTVVEHQIQPMVQAITEIATMGGRNGIPAGIVDRRTITSLLLAEIGYEKRDKLLEEIYGNKYDPAKDVTDQRSQVPPQSIVTATGKALDALSIPPPLPPPPPPPAPPAPKPGDPAAPPKPPAKNGKKAPTKESLVGAVAALREFSESLKDGDDD